jgi:hypothetical protein
VPAAATPNIEPVPFARSLRPTEGDHSARKGFRVFLRWIVTAPWDESETPIFRDLIQHSLWHRSEKTLRPGHKQCSNSESPRLLQPHLIMFAVLVESTVHLEARLHATRGGLERRVMVDNFWPERPEIECNPVKKILNIDALAAGGQRFRHIVSGVMPEEMGKIRVS